jgi:dihydroxyacetone kinase
MSIGLGIHGEPGVRDVPLQSAPELAVTLAEPLLAERPEGCRRAAVVLNGLGSVKYEELFVLFGYVADHLESQGIEIVEPECGEFVTSLDMAGVSLTMLWLDDELEELWRAPAASPAFRKGEAVAGGRPAQRPTRLPATEAAPRTESGRDPLPSTPASRRAAATARHLLEAARNAIATEAEHLGELDAVAGDGDHGIGMLRGLNAAVDAAAALTDAVGVRELLEAAGDAWSETAGGTSGALWGAGLAEFGRALGDPEQFRPEDAAAAVSAACTRIAELGGAAPGDKTMLDAMVPFEQALTAQLGRGADLGPALAIAAAAAAEGAAATSAMLPRRGRATPLAERSLGHPDPGATSFTIIADTVAGFASAGREEE